MLRNLAEKYTNQTEVGRHHAPAQRQDLLALVLQSTLLATIVPRLRVAHLKISQEALTVLANLVHA